MRHRLFDTFTGSFALIQHDDGRINTTWVNPAVRKTLAKSQLDPNLLPSIAKKLKAYFAGKPVDFSDVATPIGPDFHVKCWDACRRIPAGQTVSYGELAELAGSTTSAARAAGQAMRHNPLPIIVPCHRVIGSNGRLHGFGGSCDAEGKELGVKSALLEMEKGFQAVGSRQ